MLRHSQSTSQSPFAWKSDREQLRQLATDIKEALDNPEHDQAIQQAVIKAGVPQRLRHLRHDSGGVQQESSMINSTSPRSTITFHADELAVEQHATAAWPASQAKRRNQSENSMTSELKQEVESLLQRTDSILSRSSGHSTNQKSISAAPLPRHRTTANYFTTNGGGNGGGARSSRRATAALQEGTLAGHSTPVGGVLLPDSDASPPIGRGASGIGALGGLDALSPSSEAGVRSHARRLSQQALSELGDSRTTTLTEREGHIFDSGISADRTTLVLDKSASYKFARRGIGEPTPYANFAPLAELVDAVVTDPAAVAAAAAANTGPAAIGVPCAVAGAAGDGLPGVELLPVGRTDRASSNGHVPHKLALGYMLQPDYVQTGALSRLKADLSTLSAKQLLPITPGGSEFGVLLLALTARLSQWPRLERKAEQMFQQMLGSLMDNIFARLSPSRGKGTARTSPQRAFAADKLSTDSVGSAGAVIDNSVDGDDSGGLAIRFAAGSAAAEQTSSKAPALLASNASAATQATELEQPALPVQLSDSMVQAAFAKLALGQAMLRGMPAKGTQQQEFSTTAAEKKPTAVSAGVSSSIKHAAGAAAADAAALASAGDTPEIGISPALSRAASSACSSTPCLIFDRVSATDSACVEQRLLGRHIATMPGDADATAGQGAASAVSKRRATHERSSAAAGRLGAVNGTAKWQQELQQQTGQEVMITAAGTNASSPSQVHATSTAAAGNVQQQQHAGSPLRQWCRHAARGSHPDQSALHLQQLQHKAWAVSTPVQEPLQQQQMQQQHRMVYGSSHNQCDQKLCQQQQQQHVPPPQWLPEGPQQQQSLGHCAGLGAWMPNVGSISPGGGASKPGSSSLMLARLARLRWHGKHNRQLQWQQQHTQPDGNCSISTAMPYGITQTNHHCSALTASPECCPDKPAAANGRHSCPTSPTSALQAQQQHRKRRTWVLPSSVVQPGLGSELLQPQQQQWQQQCMEGYGQVSSPAHGPAAPTNSHHCATISSTAADTQQHYDHMQQGHVIQRQETWLQLKQAQQQRQWPVTKESSPVACNTWQSPGKRLPNSNGSSKLLLVTQADSSVQCQQQQQQTVQGGSTTTHSIRVCTAGPAGASSPPHIGVYRDGVEVQSCSPLVISVSSSPVRAGNAAAASVGAAKLAHGIGDSPCSVSMAADHAQGVACCAARPSNERYMAATTLAVAKMQAEPSAIDLLPGDGQPGSSQLYLVPVPAFAQ